MAENEQPQTYLITPPEFELSSYADLLSRMLDLHEIACVRLAMSTRDEGMIGKAADTLREICHSRDVPLLLQSHFFLVERFGLDGVHLTDGARSIRSARTELGKDAIVGAFCGISRHEGMNAGEAGADYVCFGPLNENDLNAGEIAEPELFAWWSEMIEIPVVAEGGLDATKILQLKTCADFFAYAEEIWQQEDPIAALGALIHAQHGHG